jgi:hypothetical protein
VVTAVALTDVLPVSRTAQTMVLLREFAAVFCMTFMTKRKRGGRDGG